jgi:hypothetical protein
MAANNEAQCKSVLLNGCTRPIRLETISPRVHITYGGLKFPSFYKEHTVSEWLVSVPWILCTDNAERFEISRRRCSLPRYFAYREDKVRILYVLNVVF